MSQATAQSQSPVLPSNHKFGWFFAFVFSLGAAYAFWKDAAIWAAAFSALTVTFIAVTVAAPKLLAPLNRLWFSLGMLLGKIVSPIVLGLIFFVMITPVAMVTRWFGRDELRLKRTTKISYWLNRKPPGPTSDSFKRQF